MLPFELSTNICSLNPKLDRLVLSALLEVDHQGEVVAQKFTRGMIRSAERMTYTNVHLLLEGDKALRKRYEALVPRFEQMRELAEILNRKRQRRGSLLNPNRSRFGVLLAEKPSILLFLSISDCLTPPSRCDSLWGLVLAPH